MSLADRAAERLRQIPPVAACGGLVLLQLLVVGGLERGGGWTFTTADAAGAAALISAELVLLYGVATAISGRLFAIGAALLWIVAPVLLLRFWIAGGYPLVDFATVFHEEFLPKAFGFDAREAVVAGCLLLGSGWLVVGQRGDRWPIGAAAGVTAGAAAFAHPRLWPALAAPVLAFAVARRPRAAAACGVVVAAGLGFLALTRGLPGIHPGWHRTGVNLDQLREFSWSRRLLEYLPLAGLVGLARKSAPAAAYFGWLLLTAIIFPFGRVLNLLELLAAITPALAVYALLTASIVFLVPHRRRAAAAEPATRDEPATG
jgi:hypothetical protein